jgi:hypothetical protein
MYPAVEEAIQKVKMAGGLQHVDLLLWTGKSKRRLPVKAAGLLIARVWRMNGAVMKQEQPEEKAVRL